MAYLHSGIPSSPGGVARPLRWLLGSALLYASACTGDSSAPAPLPDGTPEMVGMNAATLDGAREYAFQDDRHTQAVVVVRNGTVVAEWYANDRDRDSLGTSWSVAKSFTSALVGIAVDRGDIPSIDAPLREWIPELVGTNKEHLTLRDALEMATGIDFEEGGNASNPAALLNTDIAQMGFTAGAHLDIVLDNEVLHPPGTVFNYSSGDSMMVGRVIERATGMPASEYAQRHLFDPLGIPEARWWRDASGQTLAYCCIDLTARQFARFGQLYLDRGVYDGRRIISEGWVEESTGPSRAYERYGLHWWRVGEGSDLPADTFMALGVDQQVVIIVPSLDLVVVRLGYYWQRSTANGVLTADSNLAANIPVHGLLAGYLGTIPAERWSNAEFLAPIIDSIER